MNTVYFDRIYSKPAPFYAQEDTSEILAAVRDSGMEMDGIVHLAYALSNQPKAHHCEAKQRRYSRFMR